jgi:ADP-ribosylglycohydrolase
MRETATRSTWINFPFDNPVRIEISMSFTEKQFSLLKMGLIPRQMEDKWFVFFEDDWLYFHRSWTGHEIYRAKIIRDGEGYAIREFLTERNSEKYSNEDPAVDIENFSFIIGRGLLGYDVANIYLRRNMKSDEDHLKGWGDFGNLLYSGRGISRSPAIQSALFGVAVGDALGVPAEFKSRETMRRQPVTGMTGYGTYGLPPGTWSDDSSLTFCLAEALTKEFDLSIVGQNFVRWLHDGYWTAGGKVFDVGGITRKAIARLASGVRPELAGGTDGVSNGNGSLMRILPLVFHLIEKPVGERLAVTGKVSAITHGHIRSVIACFYYLEFARQILEGRDKSEIFRNLQKDFPGYIIEAGTNPVELDPFEQLLKDDIALLPEESIFSSGYVIHTLEAAIWCLLNTGSYSEAVLKAVNLGEDTDTTAAVTGGLAGLLYGMEGIPEEWISQVARKDDIENLANRMADFLD